MEKKKDGRGRPKGSKSKVATPKGKNHWHAKLWDVYHHGNFIGTFKSQDEVSKVVGCSAMRCWQMANGWNGGRQYDHPITSKNGYTVLPQGDIYGWWIVDKE